jgi:putative FmdB family regulatory protein
MHAMRAVRARETRRLNRPRRPGSLSWLASPSSTSQMPTYEFECPRGHHFDKFIRNMSQSVAELPCPECGEMARRLVSGGAGLLFKGSGFYITDYGKDGKKSTASAPAESKGEGKAEGKSEAKGEANSAPKGGGSKGEGGGGGESQAPSPAPPKTSGE